jgi:hypothetical protein
MLNCHDAVVLREYSKKPIPLMEGMKPSLRGTMQQNTGY